MSKKEFKLVHVVFVSVVTILLLVSAARLSDSLSKGNQTEIIKGYVVNVQSAGELHIIMDGEIETVYYAPVQGWNVEANQLASNLLTGKSVDLINPSRNEYGAINASIRLKGEDIATLIFTEENSLK